MEETKKNILFARDLINYILENSDCEYRIDLPPSYKSIEESTFPKVIGEAVKIVLDFNVSNDELEAFKEITMESSVPYVKNWATSAALDYFKGGYNPSEFIFFCGFICSFVHISCKEKNFAHCDSMCSVIFLVLEGFTLTGEFNEENGWEALVDLAENFVFDHEIDTMTEDVEGFMKKHQETFRSMGFDELSKILYSE